jgi:hypothetical protein
MSKIMSRVWVPAGAHMKKIEGYLQPSLFTVLIRHPECPTAIVTGLDLNGITAVALGAHPVKSIEAFPAQRSHETDHADQIENTAPAAILAHFRPGGFDVEFVGAGETPKWAAEVIRALDYSARRDREIKRQMQIAEAVGTPAEAERKAARAVDILSHAQHKEMFELEQRAVLVGA